MDTKKDMDVCQIPDPLAKDSEKADKSYGLDYAKAIQQEWFNGGGIQKGCLFLSRRDWIIEMRKYNRGEVDIEQDKKIISRNKGDMKLLNLDYRPPNFSEKFVNIVRNGIDHKNYRVEVRSTDKFTMLEKNDKVLQHKVNMHSRKMLESAKQLGFPDLTPKGFVPDDEDDLKLYSQIKERPKQEIREGFWIDYVKKSSDWNYIYNECKKDLIEVDIAVCRNHIDPINGVTLEYVDPENFGHSYVNRKDFKDGYYFFAVDTVTIGDIKRESGGELSETQLREIYKKYSVENENNTGASWLSGFGSVTMEQVLKQRVHVMRFCFKTTKENVYKRYYNRKGNLRKIASRDSSFEVPEGSERSILKRSLDTWYEGNYIVGSNKYIYGYKESERISRGEQNKALAPFTVTSTNIYKNELRSFLSNIVPLCNQLRYFHLKIQHLALELKPDLTVINLDQLANITTNTKGGDEASNKGKAWKEALSALQVKGVILEKTIDMGDEGGIQKGTSAKPQAVQQGSALGVLLNLWAHYYNQIRDITGINPAADGSLSPHALVGVSQMMQLSSNMATKHYVDAMLQFDMNVSYAISTRMKSIFTHSNAKHLQELYERALGSHSMELVDGLKNRHLHDFGFFIEMVSSQEDLRKLEERLAISLNKGEIDDSEVAETLDIAKTSMKQANEYMAFVRKRRIKERMQENQANIKLQSQSNAEAAQAKAMAESQKYQQEKMVDLQFEQQMSAIRLSEKQATLQMEAPEKEIEFERDVYLEQIKNMQTVNLTKYKEDEKRAREKESDTRQSKLIKQRQNNLPEQNFDNNPLSLSI